ncbi:MAG TPA: ATP-binding protein [Candidatus Angelobacter sp.]|nr:ATP-binding protein [Candidatus Angelobacter sp.]
MSASEQQLRLYRLLVENSLGLMCIHDLSGMLLMINPAAAQSLGYRVEDSAGRNIREFLTPSVQHLFEDYLQRLRTNPVDTGVMKLQAKDGTERLWLYRNVRYEEPGSPVRVLGHALDVTERMMAERALQRSQVELSKARDQLELRVAERTAELQQANERLRAEIGHREKIEEELVRTRKLEAIGRLTGGIAHDFNNLMTIILGYCESMFPELVDRTPLQKQLHEIYKAAEQANSLTRQLLAFSRPQRPQAGVLNLNEVLTEISGMLRRLLRDDVELNLMPDSDLGLICADRGHIHQVIMNLVINAADAMPRGGKMVLATANVQLEENCCHALTSPGDVRGFVCLTVSDTGIGMGPEVKARIFEPFFTTKEQGKGTGLGLATVHGIVHHAGGHIHLESEPDHGTTFYVYFPRVEGSVAYAAQPQTMRHVLTRGSETVLVVDDQESLCGLLCEVLRKAGYCVLPATSGREALQLVRQHPQQIDLVITDMVMPQMGGRELTESLSGLKPNTKVLYMSGYTDRAEDVTALLSGGHAFIEKPFTSEALLRKIRDVLSPAA